MRSGRKPICLATALLLAALPVLAGESLPAAASGSVFWRRALFVLAVAGILFLIRRVELGRMKQRTLLRESELRTLAAEAQVRAIEAENARKSQELDGARRLQLSMLPQQMPDDPSLEMAVVMRTATEVGGDYYDFRRLDDGRLVIAVGDATDHGLKAGTIVSVTKGLLWSACELPPAAFLARAGQAI